ncbi:hypothetical protein NL676_029907 [Syzygium grande]|nr:hypothetical protein NL676_029907 [Syzygium grande]
MTASDVDRAVCPAGPRVFVVMLVVRRQTACCTRSREPDNVYDGDSDAIARVVEMWCGRFSGDCFEMATGGWRRRPSIVRWSPVCSDSGEAQVVQWAVRDLVGDGGVIDRLRSTVPVFKDRSPDGSKGLPRTVVSAGIGPIGQRVDEYVPSWAYLSGCLMVLTGTPVRIYNLPIRWTGVDHQMGGDGWTAYSADLAGLVLGDGALGSGLTAAATVRLAVWKLTVWAPVQVRTGGMSKQGEC